MRNAAPRRTAATVSALGGLLGDAVDQHKTLVQGTQAADWLCHSKLSYVYIDRRVFDADRASWGYKKGP